MFGEDFHKSKLSVITSAREFKCTKYFQTLVYRFDSCQLQSPDVDISSYNV